MFTSSSNDGNATLLQNIMKIAQIIWKYSNEESKYSIGEKIDVFTVNLDDKKAKQGELFLEKCNGKNYYTKSTKCIKLATLCESLENAHNGYDNYSNEVPFAREIMSMIKSFDDIPIERQERLLSLFLKCRCGNGYDYCRGVSPNGKKYYDALFTMIDDENFKMIIAILKDNSHYMYGKNRTNNLKEILTIVRNNIISERLLEIIDAMLEFDKDDLDMLFKTKAFGEKISFI